MNDSYGEELKSNDSYESSQRSKGSRYSNNNDQWNAHITHDLELCNISHEAEARGKVGMNATAQYCNYEYYDPSEVTPNNGWSNPPVGFPPFGNSLGDIEMTSINRGGVFNLMQINNNNHNNRVQDLVAKCKKIPKNAFRVMAVGGLGVLIGASGYALTLLKKSNGDALKIDNNIPDKVIDSVPSKSTLTNFDQILSTYQTCKTSYGFTRETHTVKYKDPDLYLDISKLSCDELSHLTGAARECGRKYPDIEPSFQTAFDKHCEGYGNNSRNLGAAISLGMF